MIIPLHRRAERCRYIYGVYQCESYWSWVGRWIFLVVVLIIFAGMAYLLFRRSRKLRAPAHAGSFWGGRSTQNQFRPSSNNGPTTGPYYGRTFVQQGPNDPPADDFKRPPPAYTPSPQHTGSTAPYPTDSQPASQTMPLPTVAEAPPAVGPRPGAA